MSAKTARISLAEPVTQLRRIPIVENGESLVDFRDFVPNFVLGESFFKYRRETFLRLSVAKMLAEAARSLPKEYRLGITEGWRAVHIQRRMYLRVWNNFAKRHPDWSEVKLKRTVNRFTAPLDKRVPPPHSTGGAVDLFLADPAGNRLAMSDPYAWDNHHGFSFDAAGLTEECRNRRNVLAAALLPTGITNYPSEYWHWSYGDQGWAYRGGHPTALYAPITPVDWSPDPRDVSDEPLEWTNPDAV